MTEKQEENTKNLERLEQRVKTALETISPAPIGLIVSTLSDEPAADVKEAVLSLVAKKEIQKAGERRGTKYFNPDFDPSQVQRSAPEHMEAVLRVLTELGPQTTLKSISEKLGVDPNDLRPSLQALRDAGAVVTRGERRGMKYSLAGTDFSQIVEPVKTKKTSKTQTSEETNEAPQDFETVADFIAAAIPRLPAGKEFDISEVSNRLLKSLPFATVGGQTPSLYEVTNEVVVAAKAGKLRHQARQEEGNRQFYSREA